MIDFLSITARLIWLNIQTESDQLQIIIIITMALFYTT